MPLNFATVSYPPVLFFFTLCSLLLTCSTNEKKIAGAVLLNFALCRDSGRALHVLKHTRLAIAW